MTFPTMQARPGSLLRTLATVTLLASAASGAAADSADELMRKTFDQARVTFRGTMRLESPGGLERKIEVSHRQTGATGATYMEITAPFNLKDTRFLSFDHDGRDDEHFTYVPMVKRSMQVPQWTLEQSFLGSDFYMVDIAMPDMADFTYTFDGTGEFSGNTCRRVVSTPKRPAEEPYSKVVYCVDEAKYLSVHTEYFDEAGTLLKVWEPTKVEEIQGIWTPTDQTMRNVQGDTQSRLQILEIEYNVELDDELFGKAYLDR